MKPNRSMNLTRACACCIALLAHSFAIAQQPPAEPMNPVEHASFHQLVFADEDVAILNNLYPPKGDSGFHSHDRDLFYVVIQGSQSSVQNLGKPLGASTAAAAGTVGYGNIGSRVVHRVVNDGNGTFQIIVVEMRRATPSGKAISSREAATQYVQIVDNPRVRAWRLILMPGQSAPAITQGNKGVRIVVRGGLLTTSVPGQRDQDLAVRPGDFAIQQAGAKRALKNSGTETIELVEVELK
jgi:mannose-6-phosphate isomerase-like protein (cupin superfamily)